MVKFPGLEIVMVKSAHKAAIDQAHLIAAYLNSTPASSLDMSFIRRHMDALSEFACAAKIDSVAQGGELTYPKPASNMAHLAGD